MTTHTPSSEDRQLPGTPAGPPSGPEPTLEEWRDLFGAVIEFKELEPWKWMNEELFGVQDPASGEIGWCCITGALGEHFALIVYRGDEGFRAWAALQLDPDFENEEEMLLYQHLVTASFEDRELTSPKDREVMKALGLRFRGRSAWPLLRSYLPGYFPWYLTADEARFLAIALRQAIDVAKRFREEPAYLKPPGADQYLVRLFDGQHGMVWNDRWMAQLMPPAPLLHAPPIDSKRLAKIRRMPATHGVLEVGCFTMPGGVQESPGERPYLARVVVVMDADSRMMLGTDTTGPLDLPEKLQECLLSVLENIRMRPDEVRVEDESFVSVLKPIAGQLAIKLKLVDELTRVREAAAEFQRFAGMF